MKITAICLAIVLGMFLLLSGFQVGGPGIGDDQKPIETDGPGMHWVTTCSKDGGLGACYSDSQEPDHHVNCTDKSRFLLQSEDGKWHCLKLNALP